MPVPHAVQHVPEQVAIGAAPHERPGQVGRPHRLRRRQRPLAASVRAVAGRAMQCVEAAAPGDRRRVEAARSAVLTFEQGVIARSDDNIRVIRAAYEIGAFRVTDLLAEQRRLVDSQQDFTEALAERYRALADLQQAIGTPVVGESRTNKE